MDGMHGGSRTLDGQGGPLSRHVESHRDYVHDAERCDEIGRRIGFLLAKGLHEGAHSSLDYAIEHELPGERHNLAELCLCNLPTITLDLAGSLARAGYQQVQQLAGVSIEQLLEVDNVSEVGVEILRECLSYVGLPLPIDPSIPIHQYEARFRGWLANPTRIERIERTISVNVERIHSMETSHITDVGAADIVDLLSNVKQSDIDKVDREIKRLQDEIKRQKKVRRILVQAMGDESGSRPGRKVSDELIAAVVKDVEENGPAKPGVIGERIGEPSTRVGIAVKASKQLAKDDNGKVIVV